VNPRSLPGRWRSLAEQQRALGAEAQACTLEWCASDLETALRAWRNEILTLDQAATESGYTTEHLGRLLREGKIPNGGERGAPRIRRADLPRKPGCHGGGVATCRTEPIRSASQVVRSVLRNGGQA